MILAFMRVPLLQFCCFYDNFCDNYFAFISYNNDFSFMTVVLPLWRFCCFYDNFFCFCENYFAFITMIFLLWRWFYDTDFAFMTLVSGYALWRFVAFITTFFCFCDNAFVLYFSTKNFAKCFRNKMSLKPYTTIRWHYQTT